MKKPSSTSTTRIRASPSRMLLFEMDCEFAKTTLMDD